MNLIIELRDKLRDNKQFFWTWLVLKPRFDYNFFSGINALLQEGYILIIFYEYFKHFHLFKITQKHSDIGENKDNLGENLKLKKMSLSFYKPFGI